MRQVVVTIFCLAMLSYARADDWPMWRHDAGRTGVIATPLPESLQLQWVRHLPALKPAYHNHRLQFDAGYEPIAAGGQLLMASSRTDSVTAYDASTGQENWTYRTGGPVRLAPAVWNDSVCFGSDDGYLYCVELDTGKLRWKHRAVPSDRRLLGNGRLISVWPIRGGPVVADGRVYFAAGVWPFEGVFVYAIDVDSGEVAWRNDRLGYLFGQQPHNTQAIGGLAPQGYLVASGNDLIVPCSTAYPALLNRTTGELVEFELPGPGRFPGGWFAVIDVTTARAIRRGKIAFDDVINRQQHEDKVYKGVGVSGISRTVHFGEQPLDFDEGFEGVEGTVHSIISAEDRVFVSTREGRVYCFAADDEVGTPDKPPRQAKHWRQPIRELTTTQHATEFAGRLLGEADSRHGYAFVLGIEDGSLVKALLRESSLHVVAVDDDHDRVEQLRRELDGAGFYGERAAVLQDDPRQVELPPYIATVVTTESPQRLADSWQRIFPTLRPFGGIAAPRTRDVDRVKLSTLEPANFETASLDSQVIVRRVGALPGATEYAGGWTPSPDGLVRFPLGVLWFDDTLAHFKRSPQPQFVDGVMISRPKDWRAPRDKQVPSTDYPLLPPVLSDIYSGRVLDESEQPQLRARLEASDPSTPAPSQYRPPRQRDVWNPAQPVVGTRVNPFTGETEPRAFPKTYGCDGGVDYGSFYTLRSGTPAYYDKTLESGTVFLSGPRSGCTNSVIPSGGLLNVPYFYEGCTCSYPLPTAMALHSMPQSHEQWSSWGDAEVEPKSIERIGLNFAAPGDRMTRDGTLWLDYPSVGGPSPKIRVETSPQAPTYRYHHSLWMESNEVSPWVTASMAEGIGQLKLHDLKPGHYTARLYFAEPDAIEPGDRVQQISLQGAIVLRDFDIVAESAGAMRGIVRQVDDMLVEDVLTLELSATRGSTLISGIEVLPSSR